MTVPGVKDLDRSVREMRAMRFYKKTLPEAICTSLMRGGVCCFIENICIVRTLRKTYIVPALPLQARLLRIEDHVPSRR